MKEKRGNLFATLSFPIKKNWNTFYPYSSKSVDYIAIAVTFTSLKLSSGYRLSNPVFHDF